MRLKYRLANTADAIALAQLRSSGWGTEDYWVPRILGYMQGKNHPQLALLPRVLYVAADGDEVVGFVAGHLTRRFDCQGELEWIDVAAEYRRRGIGTELVLLLAKWFDGQGANKVCVDPGNEHARKFYTALSAENLDAHWMYWNDISTILKNP